MSEHLLFPNPKVNPESIEELVTRCHELAMKSEVVFLSEHAKERMLERNITNRQIFDVLKNGTSTSGLDLDRHGFWRIKLRRYSAGRIVQVVVIVEKDYLLIVTVI